MKSMKLRSQALLVELSRELLALATEQDEVAAAEAAKTPYWCPCPSSVEGHRCAARAMREVAATLEIEASALSWAS